MNTMVPGNAQMFYGKIAQLVVYDPIDVGDQIDDMFSLEHVEENELPDRFQ